MNNFHRGPLLSLALMFIPATIAPALAQTFTVLHSFSGADGQYPQSGLVRDTAGNIYGTTAYGGLSNNGVIYKLGSGGAFSVLYNFTGGADGGDPYATPILDTAGNLYGATIDGGSGYGVVYKLDTGGNYTVLHTFSITDGSYPVGVVLDSAGNLYGTANNGGVSRHGLVFKLDPAGNYTILHNFAGYPTDGAFPHTGMVLDNAGNLYGTTFLGGAFGNGVVFKIDASGQETVLHSFAGGVTNPAGGVVLDGAGRLFGTSYDHEANKCCGAFFRLSQDGTKVTILHNFAGPPTDGSYMLSGLVRDTAGSLYGATQYGGVNGDPPGYGVAFKIDAQGNYSILHNFQNFVPNDGAYPGAGALVVDLTGNLYGTTQNGGSSGSGVVYKITP